MKLKRCLRVFGSMAILLLLTLVAVHSLSCRATAKREAPRKETLGSLPPRNSEAQLREFEKMKAVSEISEEHAEHLVHIGKTRRELEKVYYGDGGLFSRLEGQRYVLKDQPKGRPEGHVLKLRVLFRPVNIGDETYQDPKKFRQWMFQQKGYKPEDDVVMDISAPYWEPPYFD